MRYRTLIELQNEYLSLPPGERTKWMDEHREEWQIARGEMAPPPTLEDQIAGTMVTAPPATPEPPPRAKPTRPPPAEPAPLVVSASEAKRRQRAVRAAERRKNAPNLFPWEWVNDGSWARLKPSGRALAPIVFELLRARGNWEARAEYAVLQYLSGLCRSACSEGLWNLVREGWIRGRRQPIPGNRQIIIIAPPEDGPRRPKSPSWRPPAPTKEEIREVKRIERLRADRDARRAAGDQ